LKGTSWPKRTDRNTDEPDEIRRNERGGAYLSEGKKKKPANRGDPDESNQEELRGVYFIRGGPQGSTPMGTAGWHFGVPREEGN